MINIDRALRSSIRTGKVVLGSNKTVEVGLSGQAKLIIYAADCPTDVRMQLESMDLREWAKILDLPAESLSPWPPWQ
jgi:large subunit ribosomal protein L30e